MNETDLLGETPLSYAIKYKTFSNLETRRNYQMALQLLNIDSYHACDIDSSGNGPIHLAIENNKSELVDLFLDHDFDVNQKNKDKTTPLGLLLLSQSKKWSLEKKQHLMKRMLELGADLNEVVGKKSAWQVLADTENKDLLNYLNKFEKILLHSLEDMKKKSEQENDALAFELQLKKLGYHLDRGIGHIPLFKKA